MQKGLSVPILIILLTLFAASGLGYIGYSINNAPKADVKGAISTPNIDKGFSININSNGTWDFFEYLCKTLSECENTLTSGKKFATISGGSTTDHEVVVASTASWKDYDYIKVFAKPGWGSISSGFSLTNLNSTIDATIKTYTDSAGMSYEAVIVPINAVEGAFVDSIATFSDN